VLFVNCRNCGKEVVTQDAGFCPYCSKPLTKKQSGFPTAGGILTIFAGCILLVIGLFALVDSSYGDYYYTGSFLVAGIFNVIGFGFGLTAGVLALKRETFPLAIIGASLVLISGVVMAVAIPFVGCEFAIPVAILSVLGVAFITVSKPEFS
jgi:hypothetical protein